MPSAFTVVCHSSQVVDTGLYTCRANNEAGQADLSYQVDVQGRRDDNVSYT